MADISLSLVVIRFPDSERAARFYRLLGLPLEKHRHGSGPLHYAAEVGETVFEIYPSKNETDRTTSVRLGFRVASSDRVDRDANAAAHTGENMTILDRLLGHDAWTTRQLLLRCRELSAEQMDRPFDIGDRSLRETFDHLVGCMERHTDLLMERTVEGSFREETSVEGMLKRLTAVAKDFTEFAAKVEREGRADEMITNPRNGNRRSLGGVIAHTITHSMHHRAQILSILEQLGVQNVLEGDVLGWESQARGWGWDDGGSVGRMVAE